MLSIFFKKQDAIHMVYFYPIFYVRKPHKKAVNVHFYADYFLDRKPKAALSSAVLSRELISMPRLETSRGL
jgi:hypothetical protein